MHSMRAVPKRREGDIVRPVQDAREGGRVVIV